MTTGKDNKHVSDAYRELAGEVTPAELDARILAAATREARSRYGLARAWVRPIAWAATIGLSLAFMLELTWFADTAVEPPAPGTALSEERARMDAEVMRAKREQGLHQAIGEQAEAPAEAPAAEPAPVPAADGPFAEKASLLHTAGQPARQRAESARADAVTSFTDSADEDRFCDGEARASAETWYECIRELREQGLDDAAAAEFEALRRAFPDFSEPLPK